MPESQIDSVHWYSVEDFLKFAESYFKEQGVYLGHGFDNHWDEALALIIFVKNRSWDVEEDFLVETLENEEREQLVGLCRQRAEKRVPIAYLVKESWFLGLPFIVNREVLIPRSPIAELIDDGFSLWFSDQGPKRILDMCTGSGCIGIACALTFPQSKVDASDISASALKVAAKNKQKYELGDNFELIESDLFKGLKGRKYDLIVANPPYVDAQDMSDLPQEYKHEPRIALAAGKDGLDLVKQILVEANDYLSDEGLIIVELGNSQEAMMEQFPGVPFVWLEFEHGGHGVFALGAQELKAYKQTFSA